MDIAESLRKDLAQAIVGNSRVALSSIAGGVTFNDLGMDSLSFVVMLDSLAASLDMPLEDDVLNMAMTMDEAVAALQRVHAA